MATLTTMLAQNIIFTVLGYVSLDTSGKTDSNHTIDDNNSVNVLLGASNCKRLGKVSQNCINASISGAAQDIIFTVLGYVSLFIAVITSFY
jgi:hypothetical protein